jgi:hypothetical protein
MARQLRERDNWIMQLLEKHTKDTIELVCEAEQRARKESEPRIRQEAEHHAPRASEATNSLSFNLSPISYDDGHSLSFSPSVGQSAEKKPQRKYGYGSPIQKEKDDESN